MKLRGRLNVVAPIGIIVGVAMVFIVFAVLTSARRADVVAVAQEQDLFQRAIAHRSDGVLREVEAIAGSDRISREIVLDYDAEWVHSSIELWLKTFFQHDFAFVVDPSDRVVYGSLPHAGDKSGELNTIRVDLRPIVDVIRGRRIKDESGLTIAAGSPSPRKRAVIVQSAMGVPVIIAAVTAIPSDRELSADDASPPIVVSVKFLGSLELAEIGNRLGISELRRLVGGEANRDEHVFNLVGDSGEIAGTFAWRPQRPGATIFNSVLPYITVALAGFVILAGFMLRQMRRAAARIASGEMRMRHLAMHDPLCGLPNRIAFSERLDAAIEDFRANGAKAAVFYIDLDHFKEVNDTLGHAVGDSLIRDVTSRLVAIMRAEDLIARLGGDEFAIITSIPNDAATLITMAERIIASISAPYSVNGQDIVIGASIGIATIDETSSTAADVLRYADIALYRAKSDGRNRACAYDEAMDAELTLRKRLERDLRRAIENHELSVAYQPLMSQNGETVIGVEALARWRHPELGMIPPDKFIPIAEHNGLINDLGELVLRQACTDGKQWPGLMVGVNVSPVQFRRPDFAESVERVLAETGLDPSHLEIEITESTLLGKIDTTEAAMIRLKSLGVRLALDDFGTGYASLHYLRRFPFDKLKIDRSFVQNIETAPDAAAIVNAVVGLGRGLGMTVTAEGVEREEQHILLRAAGVDTMQGYHFGRPMPANEIGPLAARHAKASVPANRATAAG